MYFWCNLISWFLKFSVLGKPNRLKKILSRFGLPKTKNFKNQIVPKIQSLVFMRNIALFDFWKKKYRKTLPPPSKIISMIFLSGGGSIFRVFLYWFSKKSKFRVKTKIYIFCAVNLVPSDFIWVYKRQKFNRFLGETHWPWCFGINKIGSWCWKKLPKPRRKTNILKCEKQKLFASWKLLEN